MTAPTSSSRAVPRRLGRDDAAHLLRRLCLGAPRGDVERFEGLRPRDAVDTILDAARTAPPDEAIALLLPAGEIDYVQAWWLDQMLGAPGVRCAESVALLWHDHFATSHDKVRDVRLMHAQYRLWREAGLGDFRELLHSAVVDPAMLVWLDGVDNEKGRPNENLARELMELFALGIGNYDEADVQEAARGLSGWTVSRRRARFERSRHDGGMKTVLGVAGELDTQGVVDAVLAHAACPRFVVGRLWEHLIARAPRDAELDACAQAFVDDGWDTGRALARLATSAAFWEADERAARIASPVEFVVRAQLEAHVRIPARDVAAHAARMGQALLRPPSVKGWDGGRNWIDSTTWIARQRFAALVADAARARENPANEEDRFAALLPHDQHPAWRPSVRALADASDAHDALRLTAILASAEYHLS